MFLRVKKTGLFVKWYLVAWIGILTRPRIKLLRYSLVKVENYAFLIFNS